MTRPLLWSVIHAALKVLGSACGCERHGPAIFCPHCWCCRCCFLLCVQNPASTSFCSSHTGADTSPARTPNFSRPRRITRCQTYSHACHACRDCHAGHAGLLQPPSPSRNRARACTGWLHKPPVVKPAEPWAEHARRNTPVPATTRASSHACRRLPAARREGNGVPRNVPLCALLARKPRKKDAFR